jgi:hypothetical protein
MSGCVDRRFVIESSVPTAQVYVDNRPVGPAPADVPFDYYGKYTITVVHPGYEPLTEQIRVKAPWWAYPPLDFAAEVLWPFRISDVRRYQLELTPARVVRTDELTAMADELRQRGQNLPPSTVPDFPATGPAQPLPPAMPPAIGMPPPRQ